MSRRITRSIGLDLAGIGVLLLAGHDPFWAYVGGCLIGLASGLWIWGD